MPPESAVAEPPAEVHAEPALTPVGDVYEQALAKARDEEAPAAKSEPAKPDVVKTEDAAVPEKAKPTSALDAALAEQPAEEKKPLLEELPKDLPNEGRKDHWARARAGIEERDKAISEHTKTINELKAQLGQAKENPEIKATLDKLTAENAELRDAITAANVELLPEFRTKYIDGRNALIGKAADKIKAYGGDAEALKDALALPEGRRRDQAIREAMGEDMDDLAKGKINSIIIDLDKLNDEAASERANSQQSFERLTQKQQEQRLAQEKEIETRRNATFDSVTKQLQSEVPTLRLVDSAVPGAEEWNNGIKGAFERTPRLFTGEATEEETVATAVKGQDYDRVAGLLTTAWRDLAAAKKELAAYDGAQPDVRGGKQPTKTGKDAIIDADPGKLYNEALAKGEDI